MDRRAWTREEEIIVFNLYCKIPFQRSSKNHPDVIKTAALIGRTPSAVNMKIGNFGSFDESLSRQGIVGLTNASKLDKEIWDEFCGNWAELAFESERLIADFQGRRVDVVDGADSFPLGTIKIATIKQRVNQSFFRSAVLAAYAGVCCITGLSTADLLIASHIKPWSASSESERTNPHNGLCINALHDKAFDKGFMTVTPDYKIHISSDLEDVCDGETVRKYFKCFENTIITIPQKFAPAKLFLQYHNEIVFEHWK